MPKSALSGIVHMQKIGYNNDARGGNIYGQTSLYEHIQQYFGGYSVGQDISPHQAAKQEGALLTVGGKPEHCRDRLRHTYGRGVHLFPAQARVFCLRGGAAFFGGSGIRPRSRGKKARPACGKALLQTGYKRRGYFGLPLFLVGKDRKGCYLQQPPAAAEGGASGGYRAAAGDKQLPPQLPRCDVQPPSDSGGCGHGLSAGCYSAAAAFGYPFRAGKPRVSGNLCGH